MGGVQLFAWSTESGQVLAQIYSVSTERSRFMAGILTLGEPGLDSNRHKLTYQCHQYVEHGNIMVELTITLLTPSITAAIKRFSLYQTQSIQMLKGIYKNHIPNYLRDQCP